MADFDVMDSLPAQLIRTRRFTAGAPHSMTWLDDGRTLFLRDERLWELDGDTERPIAEGPIREYGEGGGLVVFVRNGELLGPDGVLADFPVEEPRPDPTGRRVAYRRDGQLYVLEAGRESCLGPVGAPHTAPGRAFWWSPDGKRLLVSRVDDVRIPLPGEPLPDVRLEIVGGPVFADFDYLIDAGWDRHGPWAVVQSRDQRTVRFLGLDPVAEIAALHDDRWVHVVPGLPRRTASGAVVWHEDRDGTRFLTVDGTAVTPPGRQLRSVLSVTGEDVVFTASDDPLVIDTWGHQRRPTPASHAERPLLDLHRETLRLGPRELRAHLYLPAGHDGGPLPVLLDPYGGPARQRVTDEPDYRAYLSQWFAEQGFAVLVVDGRGTPGRGPDWEKESDGDLFGPVLDDQVTGLHEAARRRPELDLSRVGIRGWSFSGTLAVLAVLRRPDVFHVAVAGAGVTDQRRYDAYLRERTLGPPAAHPERYDRLSLLEAAPSLTRPLLLMHGLADRNVDPEHTLRLSRALTAAGRPHELMLLPGIGHLMVGAPGSEEILDRQARFLQANLSPVRR